MVNVGGPSRGCQECRRRKVKCDEAKPECLRCMNAGKTCTGYRSDFDARFINASGVGKRKYKKKHADASRDSSRKSTPTDHFSTAELLMRNDPSMFEAAMLLFEGFYTSLYNHNQSLASYIGAFTKIIIESNDGSSVRLAVSAVIRGFYSFILRSREMGALAETDFTTAVSLARVALDDPEESKSDVTLLTILLLSMFENVDCVKEHRPPITTHHIGLMHLLRHRGTDALRNGVSQFCLRHFYEKLAAAVMGADVSILTELLEAALFLPPPSSHYFSSFPITFVVPIAQLRLRVEKTNIYSKFDVSTAEDLLSSATQLDKDLSQWPDKITPSYHPRRSWSLPSDFGIGSSEGYPGWADTYPSLALAQDWNYYRYLRIVLNIFISRCAALLRKYSLAASADQVCEQMVDDVCASVLFYTGALQRHIESFKKNRQFMPEDVDQKDYAFAAIGAMQLLPRLRWILQYNPSLRERQVKWLQLQISNISLFQQVHRAEDQSE